MKVENDNNPPASSDDITKLERKIGYPLSDSYRRFLERHNGGRPFPNRFPIPDCNAEGIVDCFLGLGRAEEDICDWVEELEDLRGEFLPVGFDPGGNALIMNHLDGRIYYWDSARRFDCSDDEENTYLLAESFGDFLAKLDT